MESKVRKENRPGELQCYHDGRSTTAATPPWAETIFLALAIYKHFVPPALTLRCVPPVKIRNL
jgi:hypothetical protein